MAEVAGIVTGPLQAHLVLPALPYRVVRLSFLNGNKRRLEVLFLHLIGIIDFEVVVGDGVRNGEFAGHPSE